VSNVVASTSMPPKTLVCNLNFASCLRVFLRAGQTGFLEVIGFLN
jgi:hypothetical protein